MLKEKKNVIRHVVNEFQRIYKAKDETEKDLYSCGIYFTSINHQNANFLAKECFMYEINKKKAKNEDPEAPKAPTVAIDENGVFLFEHLKKEFHPA